jgi:hypothetical protein
MMPRRVFSAIVLFLLCFAIKPVLAETSAAPKSLGSFGVWNAFTYNEKGQPVCYMLTKIQPAKVKNKKFKRGGSWLTITHRPGETSTDVVSFTSGYNFKAGSDVDIHIGKSGFSLFTQKDTAWSRDAMTDHALAKAIRNGASMTVAGVPDARGVSGITDTVNLKGAAPAYAAIGKACGLEVREEPKPAKSAAKKQVPAKH